jgi:hypothetical protein
MAYSDFTLPSALRRFSLVLQEGEPLFTTITEVTPSDLTTLLLAENEPLALAVNTEKARSELLITPSYSKYAAGARTKWGCSRGAISRWMPRKG